jgi:hypothetical protein
MYKNSDKYSFWNTKRKKYPIKNIKNIKNTKNTKNRKNRNSFNLSYCSNCGYKGHVYKDCPEPKISLGIITFKYDNTIKDETRRYKFLLICRKHTLGFVEFVRGKYNLLNVDYLQKTVDQFTIQEKKWVIDKSFLELWNILWYSKDTTPKIHSVKSNKQLKEYCIAENKFNTFRDGYNIINREIYKIDIHKNTNRDDDADESRNNTSGICAGKKILNNYYNAFNQSGQSGQSDTQGNNRGVTIHVSLGNLINKSSTNWNTPEWGFPKGRRNLKESNLDCSKREFMEETGLTTEEFHVFYNINTLEENFFGTNNIPYKNIYYVGCINQPVSLSINMSIKCQASEVSQLGFYDLDTCLGKIRPYNREKIKILLEADKLIKTHKLETKTVDFYSNVSTYNFKKGGKV